MRHIYSLVLTILLTGCSVVDHAWLSDSQNIPEKAEKRNVIKATPMSGPADKKSTEDSKVALVGTKSLPIVPLNITPEVRREIKRYTSKNRSCIQNALNNRKEHYDLMGEIFRNEGVPEELINVAMLESQFNPRAKSSAGARGMWQFMAGTGRIYGLKVSKKQDDRLNPLLSTVAAAKHLKDLYNDFGDWHLALAAYNAGPGRIKRSLQKTGTDTFWEMSRKGDLSKETQDFVPRFIASALIMGQPEQFGFNPVG